MTNAIPPFRTRYYFASAFKMFGAYPLQYIGIMILAALSGLLGRLPIMSRVFSFLVLQPLITGIYSFAHNQATGEVPLFMDFFGAFSKKKYISIVVISLFSTMAFMGILALSAYVVFSDEFPALLKVREVLMDSSMQSPEAMENIAEFITNHIPNLMAIFLIASIAFIPVYFIVGYTGIHVIIKNEGLMPAAKAALTIIKSAPAQVVGFVLFSYMIIALGFALCGVGAIIAFPIVNIAFVMAFIDLDNRPKA